MCIYLLTLNPCIIFAIVTNIGKPQAVIINAMDGTEDDVLWQDIAEHSAADEENDMDEDLLCNDTDLMPFEKVHQLLFEENDDDDDDDDQF